MKKRSKNSHGGYRVGAGRPNLSGLAPHLKRPKIQIREPVVIEIRLAKGVPGFQQSHVQVSLVRALIKAQAKGLRVLKYSIGARRLHFLMEPYKNFHIEKCMKSFCTSFARRMNLKLGRTSLSQGSLFEGRYQLSPISGPKELKVQLKHFSKSLPAVFRNLDSLLIEKARSPWVAEMLG